jgi:hypothetical protein
MHQNFITFYSWLLPTPCVCHILFIHVSFKGQLGSSHLLAIAQNGELNIGVQAGVKQYHSVVMTNGIEHLFRCFLNICTSSWKNCCSSFCTDFKIWLSLLFSESVFINSGMLTLLRYNFQILSSFCKLFLLFADSVV